MQPNWVDFKAVKAAVTVRMVLDHYGVNWLREKGSELSGRCPIHKGKGEDPFHANTEKNNFHCFAGSCGKRGNVLDLVAAMEKCTVRDAALKLVEWFSIGGSLHPKPEGQNDTQLAREETAERGEASTGNPPLKFQLKGIDPAHAYLRERGIQQTAETFGAGFFPGKGSMSGRVVIPIHNERGELVAYAGRAIDETEPKYKLPSGFQKSSELFNLHRAIASGVSTVVLVEGFFDCIKVHEAGFPCVALMGCSLSARQEELLRGNFSGAVLLFDGDEAGLSATDECLRRLGRSWWVKAVMLPEGKQPDMLTAEQIHELLAI